MSSPNLSARVMSPSLRNFVRRPLRASWIIFGVGRNCLLLRGSLRGPISVRNRVLRCFWMASRATLDRGLRPIFRTRRLPCEVVEDVGAGDCDDHGLNAFMILLSLELDTELCESWLLLLSNGLNGGNSSSSLPEFVSEDISSPLVLIAPCTRRRACKLVLHI